MGMWVGRGRKARAAYGFDDIALVPGALTINPNEVDISWELCGRRFEIPMLALYCAAIRRSLLDRIGLLDERFGVGMFEDDDLSRRVREVGLGVMCAEDAFVHHWGRASFGRLDEAAYQRLFEENRRRYEEKWGEPWKPHRSRQVGRPDS